MNEKEVKDDVAKLKSSWIQRGTKFKEWYDLLSLEKPSMPGMEVYVSNDPRTFYNMALYLFATGEVTHSIGIEGDNPSEFDKQAKVSRGCQYVWKKIDYERQRGGNKPFLQELGFYVLTLGWYSIVYSYDEESSMLIAELWNPAEVYPRFEDGEMTACTHSYSITKLAAKRKANLNGWDYPTYGNLGGSVTLDNYFYLDEDNILQNMILIENKDVTGLVPRENMKVLVSPVGGFPDKGSIKSGETWKGMLGQGIFEAPSTEWNAFNKLSSFVLERGREAAEPKWIERSAGAPKVQPEQLKKRRAVFHYGLNEGLDPVVYPAMPVEIPKSLDDFKRNISKSTFSDAVYGIVGNYLPGYTLSQILESSANQILYPYMEAKHFLIAEGDKFWLKKQKTSKRVFQIKGRFIEKLKPTDIPDDVDIEVESDIATAKDWLQRAQIAAMLTDHVDETFILNEVLKVSDPQAVGRRRKLDSTRKHPLTQNIEMVNQYRAHADYLRARGDSEQAEVFMKAADALEAQFSVPPAGAGAPTQATDIEAAKRAGVPRAKGRVRPETASPEEMSGMTPEQMRQTIGRGAV